MENISKEQISDSIFLLHNVLSVNECDQYILFSESQNFQEATVSLESGAKMMKNIRNNKRLTIENQGTANLLWEKVKSFIPDIEGKKPIGLNERIRFYKYDVNERFNTHIDGRVSLENKESLLSFLIYLNDDYVGGQTQFKDYTTTPKTGTALCFIHELKHKGVKVEEGTKYVLRSDIFYERSKIRE